MLSKRIWIPHTTKSSPIVVLACKRSFLSIKMAGAPRISWNLDVVTSMCRNMEPLRWKIPPSTYDALSMLLFMLELNGQTSAFALAGNWIELLMACGILSRIAHYQWAIALALSLFQFYYMLDGAQPSTNISIYVWTHSNWLDVCFQKVLF